MQYEYRVLGEGATEVAGGRVSLHCAMAKAATRTGGLDEIADVLNALAADGWEPVLLTYPYVFRRLRAPAPLVPQERA